MRFDVLGGYGGGDGAVRVGGGFSACLGGCDGGGAVCVECACLGFVACFFLGVKREGALMERIMLTSKHGAIIVPQCGYGHLRWVKSILCDCPLLVSVTAGVICTQSGD